jgi:hypothetical protein
MHIYVCIYIYIYIYICIKEPPWAQKQKHSIKTSTQTPICVYRGIWGGYIYIGLVLVHGFLAISWIPSKKWFPRLSTKVESLGNSILAAFGKKRKICVNYVAM